MKSPMLDFRTLSLPSSRPINSCCIAETIIFVLLTRQTSANSYIICLQQSSMTLIDQLWARLLERQLLLYSVRNTCKWNKESSRKPNSSKNATTLLLSNFSMQNKPCWLSFSTALPQNLRRSVVIKQIFSNTFGILVNIFLVVFLKHWLQARKRRRRMSCRIIWGRIYSIKDFCRGISVNKFSWVRKVIWNV